MLVHTAAPAAWRCDRKTTAFMIREVLTTRGHWVGASHGRVMQYKQG